MNPCLRKCGRGDCHAGSACAQHHREVFVCESDLFGVYAIVRQQKPPRASFINCMHSVACGKLPQHIDISLKKSVEHAAKLAIPAVE